MTSDDEVDLFLAEACRQGFLAADAAAECRKIARLLVEMGTAMPIDEIAVKKGFLRQEQSFAVRRAVAPKRLGRYELLDRLGSGGAGVVWRARNSQDGSIVALKYLTRAVADDERVRERFLREARVALALSHPNIVRGLDSGEDGGAVYLVMEFVPGESLATRLARDGRLAQREAFRIALEVVRALDHVRQFKLVHRDIKPANLLLTPDGGVKLCDLGLTRASLHEAKDLGIEEMAIGTPTYVSPEQIERPDSIDWRADVYSLGATLYHAVTGSPPFTGDSPKAIARKHLDTPARDPREHVLDLSEGAATVILKMLHKDPTKRYASLADLAEDLEAVRDGRTPVHTLSVAPIAAKPAAPERRRAEQRPRATPRRSGSTGVLVAGVALAAAGGAFWFATRSGGRRSSDGAATSSDSASNVPQKNADDAAADPARTVDPRGRAAAVAALQEALAFGKAHPDDFDGTRRGLEDVARRFDDVAADARSALARLEEARLASAERELTARAARAAEAETAGNLRDAWKAFHGFPEVYRDSHPSARAAAEARRIQSAAAAAFARAAADVRRAADETRFADARASIDAAARVALPDAVPELAAVGAYVESKEGAYKKGRELQRASFDELRAQALDAAGRDDPEAARALLQSKKDAVRFFAAESAALERDLHDVERVQEAARRRWSAMSGQSARLAAPDRPGGAVAGAAAGVSGARLVVDGAPAGRQEIALHEIAASDLLDLASRGLDPTSAADLRALFLYAVSRDDLARAKSQAELARLAGASGEEMAADLAAMRRRVEAQAADLTRRAELARRQKRLPEARAALERAARLFPDDAATLTALAGVLVESDAWDDARAALERALAAKDPPIEARYRLAQVLSKSGDLERAVVECGAFVTGAAKDDPLRPEAERMSADLAARFNKQLVERLRREADLSFSHSKWAEAESAYAQILKAAPGDAEAGWRLGKSLLYENKVFAAFKRITLFVREHPKDARIAEAQRDLAQINDRYRASSDAAAEASADAKRAFDREFFDEAASLYRKALAAAPFLEEARLGLGRALLARGMAADSRDDLFAAVAEFDDLLFLHPDAPSALVARAGAYVELGDGARALADAVAASKADPANVAATIAAGHAQILLGRFAEAEALFAAALRREPGAEAFYGHGLALEKLGRVGEALREYRQAIDGYRTTPVLRVRLAEAARRAAAREEGR